MQAVLRKNMNSPEEKIYEKSKVDSDIDVGYLSVVQLWEKGAGADRDHTDTRMGFHGTGTCQNAADL